jgi:hypothetical protein
MLKKGHALALAVTTAGLIGLSAPIASAAVAPGPVLNVSNNQAPLQACGNTVDTNGAGGQVPVQGAAFVGSLLSPGATTNATSLNNRGCEMVNNQTEGRGRHHGHNSSGLVNVANNQLPTQACGNEVNTNGAGGQVPLSALSGALSFLSPFSVTNATAVNNQGCALVNNQHG